MEREAFLWICSVVLEVRDATARLPNGQGTRADICMLLRDSQYLIENAPDSDLNSVVSGALDRLHYETDPCVKYDTKRKIWIYLHRARNELEFERLHQEQQRAVKPKNPRKAHRAKVMAAIEAAPPVIKPPPKPPAAKRVPKAPTKPKAAATQQQTSSWLQAKTAEEKQMIPDIDSVEVKVEQIESVSITTPPPAPPPPPPPPPPPQSTFVQKHIASPQILNKATATNQSLLATTKKIVPTAKVNDQLVDNSKSILAKNNRPKPQTVPKITRFVKDPPIKRIMDTPVSAPSPIRRTPDNSVTPVMMRTVLDPARASKSEMSLLDPAVTAAAKKKTVVASPSIMTSIEPTNKTPKSLVKMMNTLAGVRTVQSPAHQVMLVKQRQQSFITEPSSATMAKSQQQQQGVQTQQQLIVMKQSADSQSASPQHQMIVINQQQIVTDQQLTVKQHKQLQQMLTKQQYTAEQQQHHQQQQQQIQQIYLAKQQMLSEQQKTGKPQQQQMIVVKQQQTQVDPQQKPQVQQMILVKQDQQQHVITSTESQQITQQHLQLLLKQQQLQQSQQIQTSPTVTQTKTQTMSLAQFQQLQQQQQQQQQQQHQTRVVTSTSLLAQPRVVSQVVNQPISTGVQVQSSNLLKPQQMVAKVNINAQGQPVLSVESILAHPKQLASIPQTLRVATASTSGKSGLQPQYTVVSVAQPRVIQASQLSQTSTGTVASASVSSQASTVRMTQPNNVINFAHIGGKPVLLTSSKPQSVLGGQTVLLGSSGIRTQQPLTLVQQGGQQILLPPGFHASGINLKGLQGLKVIPITPSAATRGATGRQQVFARIINPTNMRPVVTSVLQAEQSTSSNPPAPSKD